MSARLDMLIMAVAVAAAAASLGAMAVGQGTTTTTPPPPGYAEGYGCLGGNYTDGSAYARNLAALLSTLSVAAAADEGRFKNGSVVAAAAPDRVWGLVMCYADCAPARCRDCLGMAAGGGLVALCPNSRRMAFLDSDGCLLRYADAPILSGSNDTVGIQMGPYGSPTDDATDAASLNATRWQLLEDLAGRAAAGVGGDQHLLLANGSQAYTDASGNAQVVYGLVQCIGDLPPAECTKCLMDQLAEVSWGEYSANNFTSVTVRSLSCSLRYQVNDPIDIPGLASPPPSTQTPPASPSGSGAASPPAGSKTPLIAGLAMATTTVILLALGA